MFPNILNETVSDNSESIKVTEDTQFVIVKSADISGIIIDGVKLPKDEVRDIRYGDLEGARIRIKMPLWEVFVVNGEFRLYRSSISNDGIWANKSTVRVSYN